MLQVRTLHEELQFGIRSAALDQRRQLHGDGQIAESLHPLAGQDHQLFLRLLPLFQRSQFHDDGAAVHLFARIGADRRENIPDAGQLLEFGFHLLHHRLRTCQRRSGRHADYHFKLALIVGGKEAHAGHLEQGHDADNNQHRHAGDDPAVRHGPTQHGPIRLGDMAEETGFLSRLPVFLYFRLQESRAQHRRQRKADQQRNHDGERRRVSEARHELSNDAAHQRHRNEDDHQAERRRKHGEADVASTLDGRLHWTQTFLFGETENVFQNHNGVVDHDADHQHQRQHGDLIQREAHQAHQRVGGDDRCRNGDGRNQRGPPASNEHEHDARGKDSAQNQMLLDRFEGV